MKMERYLFHSSYERLRGTFVFFFIISGRKRYEHQLPVSTDRDPVASMKREKQRHNSLHYLFLKQSSLQANEVIN